MSGGIVASSLNQGSHQSPKFRTDHEMMVARSLVWEKKPARAGPRLDQITQRRSDVGANLKVNEWRKRSSLVESGRV